MNSPEIFRILVWSWLALGGATFVLLLFVSAPYGRHARRGWGPTIPPRLGWLVMEAPPLLVMVACFALGDRQTDLVALTFLGLWLAHYLHRDLVYPLRMGRGARAMPLVVIGLGVIFNGVNGYLNGHWLFSLSPAYGVEWLLDPRFVIGTVLFFTGFGINLHADGALRRLAAARTPGGDRYSIPTGGLYRWVSCPNYLGELLQWCGWAVATWSLPGLTFAVWTAVNLVPRARAHHRWYRERFPDYPANRKAIIPTLY